MSETARGRSTERRLPEPGLPCGWRITSRPSGPTTCRRCGAEIFYFEALDDQGRTHKCMANAADGTYHGYVCSIYAERNRSSQLDGLVSSTDSCLQRLETEIEKIRIFLRNFKASRDVPQRTPQTVIDLQELAKVVEEA